MAVLPTDPTQRPPDFKSEVVEKLGALADADTFAQTSNWLVATLLTFVETLIQELLKAMGWLAGQFIRGVFKGVELADPAFGEIAKAGIQALFGVDVPATAFNKLSNSGAREQVKKDVGRAMLGALTGLSGNTSGASVQPSLDPAEKYLGTIANFAIEGWLLEIMPELESLGWLENFGELKDTVAQMFGFGRLTRRILGPAIDALIKDPMLWQVNKTYRGTLLSPSTALRQFMRGRWDWPDVVEELARQGYSDERINALLNEQRKFFSVGDVRTFVDRGHWTGVQGIQHLRDQGYDEDGALEALRLEGIRRIDQVESQQANAIMGAYVARDIDRGEFLAQLAAHVTVATERGLFEGLGDLRRALNIKQLSSGDVAAAVKARILAYVDYREALAREGYTTEAITVKDLLLRWEIDKQTSIDKHRADLDAERAIEKQTRDAAAAAKRAQVEADAQAKRRGSPASLERAVVRGLIPIARYTEVLGADYDPDTVQILVDLVEGDRQTYLEQQAKAAAAAQRAAGKGLDVGQLQAAVLENVLTIQQFRAALQTAGFAGADVEILTATLQARKADADQAKADRAAAAVAAKRKAIDLAQFEQLVRRGIRPIAQYQQLLASLGFDEASQAGLVELLQAKIADDAAAAAARADADTRKAPGELTIADFRRAVLLGVKTAAEFDAFLTQQKLTSDKHALLVAELADDVDQAETARRRRAAADASLDARAQQLALVRRAARLGIVTVATYQARLEQAGWTADDIAIETELLLVEIADVQTARATRDTVERTLQASGLSLAETARAVRAGVLSLDAYQTRALAIGVDAGDVAILVRVLGDELTTTTAAKARRAALESTLKPSGTSIAVLEDQVRAGALSIDDYETQLEGLGLALDDAELLASLVLDELGASGSVTG
jgi:hypothetical protein